MTASEYHKIAEYNIGLKTDSALILDPKWAEKTTEEQYACVPLVGEIARGVILNTKPITGPNIDLLALS